MLAILLLALTPLAPAQSFREQILTSQLEQDPQNVTVILNLAAHKLEQASGIINEDDRAAQLDAVQVLYLKANSLDPRNVEALYRLGVVSWMKVFPAVVAARRHTAMDPETPGPIRDRSERAVLNARYRADLNYAITTLEQAVALDPSRSDAMAYLHMAYRARADFKDTRSEWDEDQSTADSWRERAWDVGSAKLPEMPAPALHAILTVDAEQMRKNLIHSAPAVCPVGVHVVGAVPSIILDAMIAADGTVHDLTFQDGPAELTTAAVEAASRWTYRSDLLDRNQTIKTVIEVPFLPCP